MKHMKKQLADLKRTKYGSEAAVERVRMRIRGTILSEADVVTYLPCNDNIYPTLKSIYSYNHLPLLPPQPLSHYSFPTTHNQYQYHYPLPTITTDEPLLSRWPPPSFLAPITYPSSIHILTISHYSPFPTTTTTHYSLSLPTLEQVASTLLPCTHYIPLIYSYTHYFPLLTISHYHHNSLFTITAHS